MPFKLPERKTCRNTADAVPLYLPQQLYLKPAAHINISIQIPNVKKIEKTISHWEIMEKLRALIRPDEFAVLKVSKTTLEIIRFEAEIENRTRLDKVLSKLENNSITLKDIPDIIRVKAGEMKSDFPHRMKWDSFFQEARDMDEMKPGQRPDTIYLSHLPIKWFSYNFNDLVNKGEAVLPSEKIFYRVFEKFGAIRYVDIPICDPYRKKMKEQLSGFKTHSADDSDLFEGYVQFKDYIGFTRTMDALRGMKLLQKEDDEAFCCNIKTDFDRNKHLSDASIRRREIVRERLVKKQKEREEKEKNEFETEKQNQAVERDQDLNKKSAKEQRRKEREARRKSKILEKLKCNDCDDINEKIEREEKKLLKAQRKLESIRLVEELFRRIKEKKDEFVTYCKGNPSANNKELKRYKDLSELEVIQRRQNLHHAIEGRVVLRSILSGGKKKSKSSSSSSTSSIEDKTKDNQKNVIPLDAGIFDPNWYAYPYAPPLYPPPYIYHHGPGRPGPSRSYRNGRHFRGRFRGNYRRNNSQHFGNETDRQFESYFSNRYYNRKSRSRSKSAHRRSRTYSRSSSRSRSRSRERRRERSVSHYTPRKTHREREESVETSKFISPRSLRRQRSKSWSMPKNGEENKRRTWSKSPEK